MKINEWHWAVDTSSFDPVVGRVQVFRSAFIGRERFHIRGRIEYAAFRVCYAEKPVVSHYLTGALERQIETDPHRNEVLVFDDEFKHVAVERVSHELSKTFAVERLDFNDSQEVSSKDFGSLLRLLVSRGLDPNGPPEEARAAAPSIYEYVHGGPYEPEQLVVRNDPKGPDDE